MRILCLGDVFGQSGFDRVCQRLPALRAELQLDFVLVNAENAADGHGLWPKQADALIAAGADVLTLGNHSWDRPEIKDYIWNQPRLIRPLNYEPNAAGRGKTTISAQNGKRVLVVQLHGQLFMRKCRSPYDLMQEVLRDHALGAAVDAILVDVHAECNSEKQVLAYMADGKVTAVFGTHTHVPTADTCILEAGTAYQTDLGMCGPQRSIVGFDVDQALKIFAGKAKGRVGQAPGPSALNGLVIVTDDDSGLAIGAERFSWRPAR